MTEIARRDVYQAIADPNRRKIIEHLSRESMTLNALAGNFDITRSAVSQHIKLLQECGVVEVEQKGRERYCSIRPKSLVPAFLWLEQYQRQWTDRINNFEQFVNKRHVISKNKRK